MKRSTSKLLVVLGEVDPTAMWTAAINGSADNVIRILASDLSAPAKTSISGTADQSTTFDRVIQFLPRQKFARVSAIAKNGSAKHLNVILDSINSLLMGDAHLTIAGFRINKCAWTRLTELFEHVSFYQCHLASEMWGPPREDRRCESLYFFRCTGTPSVPQHTGNTAWPCLTTLLICEGNAAIDLSPRERPDGPTYRIMAAPSSNEMTKSIAGNLWHSKLKSVSLYQCSSLDFLSDLPTPNALSNLALYRSPTTLQIFHWILKNKSLRRLEISWQSNVKLPWHRLRALPKLRTLEAIDSHLDDCQLLEIAENTKLRTILLYYSSNITAASWKTLLSWPSLRSAWGSSELMNGTDSQRSPARNSIERVRSVKRKA